MNRLGFVAPLRARRELNLFSPRKMLGFLVLAVLDLAGCRVQIGNDGMGCTDPGTPGVEWYHPDPEMLRTDGASSNTYSARGTAGGCHPMNIREVASRSFSLFVGRPKS